MSTGEWLAAVATVLVLVGTGALLAVLMSLTATLKRLRGTLDGLRQETVGLTEEMRETVRDAGREVDRVDALVTAAESVSGRLDAASRLAHRTVQSPMVKALALGTGTKRAVKALRGEKLPSGRRRVPRGKE